MPAGGTCVRRWRCSSGVFPTQSLVPPEPALPGPSRAPAWAGFFSSAAHVQSIVASIPRPSRRAPTLIVAVIVLADGEAGGGELTAAQSVLLRLARKQKLAGDYASTMVRDAGRPEIYLAFEDEGAAREFAAVVKAKATAG